MPAVRQRLFRQNPLNQDSPKFPVLRYGVKYYKVGLEARKFRTPFSGQSLVFSTIVLNRLVIAMV